MSFSSDVKAELCRDHPNKKCCALAESLGILLFCSRFTPEEVRIVTRCGDLASRLPGLFRRAFNVTFDRQPEPLGPEGGTFAITDRKKLSHVYEALGSDARRALSHHVNFGLLEEDCDRVSYLRGAFFAGGSVTAPEKRYHLELVTDHRSVARETAALLTDMGFDPKLTERGGRNIVYFKNSSAIEDLLTTLGAPVKAMDVMSAKIERELTNRVQRQVNCDTANAGKTVEAAAAQTEAIRRIRDRRGLEWLPDKLQETARLRLDHPEMSLAQLAESCDPPVTKSCLSHRLRKLAELAKEIP